MWPIFRGHRAIVGEEERRALSLSVLGASTRGSPNGRRSQMRPNGEQNEESGMKKHGRNSQPLSENLKGTLKTER